MWLMASIDARHAYRFGYLKSEHWSNLRLRKLALEDAKCKVCKHRDLGNDVHHVVYRSPLTSVKVTDLVVLCRKCHSRVHQVLDANKEILSIEKAKKRWQSTLGKIRKIEREEFVKAKIETNKSLATLGHLMCAKAGTPHAFKKRLLGIMAKLLGNSVHKWKKAIPAVQQARKEKGNILCSRELKKLVLPFCNSGHTASL